MRNRLMYAGVALALGLTLGACSDDSGTTPKGSGRISIMLTDAPSDSIVAAVVTITDVYLQPSPGDSVSKGNRVYLREGAETTLDLLELRDSVTALVNDSTLPAGTYSQLRFVVTGAYVEVEDASGDTRIYATSPDYEGLPAGAHVDGELVAPSFATSGFKVSMPGGVKIEEGQETELLADFDVAQSFGHQAGASGKWVLHPVVKVTEFTAASNLTVNVALGTGVTLPAGVVLTGFQAQLTDASGNVRTAPLVTGTGGTSARFGFLLPENGPYEVTLLAPTGFKVATSTPALPVTGVTLVTGANTQLITLTSVTPI